MYARSCRIKSCVWSLARVLKGIILRQGLPLVTGFHWRALARASAMLRSIKLPTLGVRHSTVSEPWMPLELSTSGEFSVLWLWIWLVHPRCDGSRRHHSMAAGLTPNSHGSAFALSRQLRRSVPGGADCSACAIHCRSSGPEEACFWAERLAAAPSWAASWAAPWAGVIDMAGVMGRAVLVRPSGVGWVARC